MRRAFAPLLVGLACSPRAEMAVTSSTTDISPSTSGSPSTTTTDTATTEITTTTTADTTTSSSSSSSDDGPAFIISPDFSAEPWCDIWEQDCPRGEKCSIWGSNGGEWDATKCTPIARNPSDVGEACTVEGSATSGIDDCVLGATCLNVDPDTGLGECIAFCIGPRANPTCADACSQCTFGASGILFFCLPICDPLVQDCGEGEACLPTNLAFACTPLAHELAGAGESCNFVNVCEPGLVCVGADVPGCEGTSCCTPFCDATAPDACNALLPDTTCLPFYNEGEEPETCLSGTVGFCGVAQ